MIRGKRLAGSLKTLTTGNQKSLSLFRISHQTNKPIATNNPLATKKPDQLKIF
jgi:hypothetical protein